MQNENATPEEPVSNLDFAINTAFENRDFMLFKRCVEVLVDNAKINKRNREQGACAEDCACHLAEFSMRKKI